MNLKTKKILILSICAALLIALGILIVYALVTSQSDGSSDNSFVAGQMNCSVINDGASYSVRNDGNADAYIRAAVIVNWKKGDSYVPKTTNASFTSEQNWIREDTIFYYTEKVPAGQSTSKLIIDKATIVAANSDAPAGATLEIRVLAEAIQATKGTYTEAWEFAEGNGFVGEEIRPDEAPDDPTDPNACHHSWLDATCTEPQTCSICGKKQGTPLGHIEAILEGIPVGCETNGVTEGKMCTRCNVILIPQTEIAALGHNYVSSDAFKCANCGLTKNVTIDDLDISADRLHGNMQNILLGDTVYNETVMFINYGETKQLLFPISEIISVESYDGKTRYVEGRDYLVVDGKLHIPRGSAIDLVTDSGYYNYNGELKLVYELYNGTAVPVLWGEGITMTQWQIRVTYKHTDTWNGFTQESQIEKFEGLVKKLMTGQDVTFIFYGDSITCGSTSSWYADVPTADWYDPTKDFYQWSYSMLFTQALADMFGYTIHFVDASHLDGMIKAPPADYVAGDNGTITYINTAVGGWTSADGLNNFDKHIKPYIEQYGCDLLSVAFGMNDMRDEPTVTANNVKAIYDKAIAIDQEFYGFVISTMAPNNDAYNVNSERLDLQESHLEDVVEYLNENAISSALVRMTSQSYALLERITFRSYSSNNYNHPNDFMGRVYAQTCLQAFIGYENIGEISAHEHVEITIPGKVPTCSSPGLSEGKMCTVCGQVTVKQEPLSAHIVNNGECSLCFCVIPYIGCISSINGLGPDGTEWTLDNSYHNISPSSKTPSVTYPAPVLAGDTDYYCRSFSVSGWALLEGGQSSLYWSDNGGTTWKLIENVIFTNGDEATFKPFATYVGILNPGYINAQFAATIDLSGYADGERINICIGQKAGDGTIINIFKFNTIVVGKKTYVYEKHEECEHAAMSDPQNPIYIISFDVFESSLNLTDAGGRADRLRVRVFADDPSGYTSIANNVVGYTWNQVVHLLDKDVNAQQQHTFTLEGWVAFDKTGFNYDNVNFSAEVYRNGELYRTASGESIDVAINPGIAGVIETYNLPGGSIYRVYLDANSLQNGDRVHIVMTHTDGEGTITKFCIKDFTIQVVTDDTDLSATINCTHSWSAATCTAPKTCSLCGAKQGSVLDHTWQDATCTTPKKCSVCGATEGETTEHTWTDASCTAPKTCTVCGTTSGAELGHSYVEGICQRCGAHNNIPPVETPADKPVDRVDHSPYEYFHCGSCGYISVADGLSEIGDFRIDSFVHQTTGNNYVNSISANNAIIVTETNGIFNLTGWMVFDTDNYELAYMKGDLYNTWSLAVNTSPEQGVWDKATAAGRTNAIRFTYYFAPDLNNGGTGETIHLILTDKNTGLKYCFYEFTLRSTNLLPNAPAVMGSVDGAKHERGTDYTSAFKAANANGTITVNQSSGVISIGGWMATTLTNYSYSWRLNEEYRTYSIEAPYVRSDAVPAAQAMLGSSATALQYTFYLGLENIKSGDTIYFFINDNSTGKQYCFARYTIVINDSTANYNLISTVTHRDPVTNKEEVTAPSEDQNLKMWFDHLTQKTSRYDTSNKNSTNSSYTIQMARNEMEGCHFYLYSPTNKKITIRISDFMNEYGETLKTELGVEFYLEDGYISNKGFTEGQTSASGNVVGVYPDAVIPYESYIKDGYGGDEGGSYEYGTWVPIGPYSYKPWELANYPYRETVRGFTIQATTLRTSRPGQYSATVEIYDAETGECIKMANVYTYVYDVIMSEETALDTYIGVWNEYYIQTYQKAGGYNDAEVIKALANFMLDYRLTPVMGGWATENVLGVEWLYNPRVTTFRVADKETYDKYKNDPILAGKMVYYGQDEPGAPRNQYRGIKLADGTSVTYFDAFGMLAVLGVAEEAKMLQSWGWDDYRLLIPIERNPDFTDFSTYPDLGQTGVISGMSWAAIEAALQEQGAKDLYNKYKTELHGSADMFEFLSNYISLWVYTYTGSTPRVLSGTSGCRYMQAAAHDAEFGEFYQRMKAYKAEGDEIWGYVACEPQWHSPYQNILLFNDGTEARTMFWTSYKLGQTGWLYWREDFYGAANTNTYPMRAPYSNTGPGDGILVYPGAIYGQLDPIPSIRFINMRDGVEDYQLLCMLEETYGEAKAMEMVNNIVTSTVTFTRDDDKIYNVHAEILRLLEEAN